MEMFNKCFSLLFQAGLEFTLLLLQPLTLLRSQACAAGLNAGIQLLSKTR